MKSCTFHHFYFGSIVKMKRLTVRINYEQLLPQIRTGVVTHYTVPILQPFQIMSFDRFLVTFDQYYFYR